MFAQLSNHQSIVTESIEQGLDRKQLRELQHRFLLVNQQRLQRTHSALTYRQQIFLQALPLLFHANHPLLPGYMGTETPHGICEHKATKQELQLGKTFARSFRLTNALNHTARIESLFVMGSMGTIAQGRASDLDIWVCHSPDLNAEEIQLLKQKCDALSENAKAVALDCHFFLMNAENFRNGIAEDLSSEASGSTQHVLLLDEFYRTALWLAGRLPLWWLVPAEREQHYQDYRHQLINKRFIQAKHFIDFGPAPNIPPEEFTGAALWQLYKAIEAPYKSVFKLLLLEAYTYVFPGFQALALSFKQQVYHGEVNIDELDPYIVAYRRVEYYLMKRNQTQRLELVRRCLYFKINKPLSKKPQDNQTSWQRRLLHKLVDEWGWSPKKIAELDQRRHWKAGKVVQERQALVQELLNSYKNLLAFNKRHQAATAIDPDEFNTLGRKLYASYERRSGKVDWINPGIADDLSESQLCFLQDEYQPTRSARAGITAANWRVYASSKAALDNSVNWQQVCPMPLKHGSLMELILWCHCNGLLTSASRNEFIFNQHPHNVNNSSAQIYPLIRAIQQWLPLPLRPVPHESFKRRAITTHLFIHVNLGREPDQTLHEKGLYHISDIDDALGYGELKQNLVKSIDIVSRNSWNEIQSQHFENDSANVINNNALALCLRTCLQAALVPDTTAGKLPEIRVHCGSSASGNTIRHRVETLIHDVLRCYNNPQRPFSTRYLFSIESGYYACQCQVVSDNQVQARLEALPDREAVTTYLSRKQERYSPLVFDRFAQVEDCLRLIAKVSDSRGINVVFRPQSGQAELIVLDEQGSLFRDFVHYYNEVTVLRTLHHFLRSAIRRQTILGGDFRADFDVFPVRFYKLCFDKQHAYLKPCTTSTELTNLPCIPIKAKAQSDMLGNESLTLWCGDRKFSQTELGDKLFATVRKTLGNKIQSNQDQPFCLCDLDLSDYHLPGLPSNQWQTSHYLRLKVDLERRLNRH